MPLCSPVARSIGMYTSITCAAIERQLVIRQIVRESEGSGRGGQRGAPEIPSLPRSSLEQDLRARTADARCWRTQAHERGKNAARGFAASELNPLFTPCSIARPRLANAPCVHHNPRPIPERGSRILAGRGRLLFTVSRGASSSRPCIPTVVCPRLRAGCKCEEIPLTRAKKRGGQLPPSGGPETHACRGFAPRRTWRNGP